MRKVIFIILLICLACTSANFNIQSSPAQEISSSYVHQLQLLAEYSLDYVHNSFAFSPDGELIAINHGRSLSIIQLDNLELVSTIHPPFGPNITSPENDEESIQAIAFLTNETLVTGSSYSPYGGDRDGSLRLWDVQSQREIAVLEEEAAVWNLVVSPDGRFIAYFRSLEIVLMKLEDRSIVYQTTGTNRFIQNYMGFTADSRQFAIWSNNGVSIINLESQEESFINNDWGATGAAALRLSPDSQTIALWTYAEIELYSLDTLELISHLSINDDASIVAPTFEVNGSRLIVGIYGDTIDIEIYDYVSSQSIFSMDWGEDVVFSLASHPRYPVYVTGSRNGILQLWDLETASDRPLFQSSLERSVLNVGFSPDGHYLVVSSDTRLEIWGVD